MIFHNYYSSNKTKLWIIISSLSWVQRQKKIKRQQPSLSATKCYAVCFFCLQANTSQSSFHVFHKFVWPTFFSFWGIILPASFCCWIFFNSFVFRFGIKICMQVCTQFCQHNLIKIYGSQDVCYSQSCL